MQSQVQPLRINKGTPLHSPTKANGVLNSRPLAEINPAERRRNSPSFNQATKKSFLDSSPLDSSPFASKFNNSPFISNSPRVYWQNRDSTSPVRQSIENREPRDSSPSPAKRSSIENLKKASRVKNSSMFAREQKQEYDPASVPLVERPLAAGRPLNTQVTVNVWGRKSDALRSPLTSPTKELELEITLPVAEPQKSPARHLSSPSKSSLSRNSRYGHMFDPETGTFSEDEDVSSHELPNGKSLRRHAKSVTFDQAPPQVNEYEMTTPDPSSIASGSREGSYDSIGDDDDEEEDTFDFQTNGGHDDSFDASLEDTDKTPVVLPEDWRFMSPERANDDLASTFEDPFATSKSSPAPGAQPVSLEARSTPTRTDSINSNGERRPLPPLPPPPAIGEIRGRSSSPSNLHATAERVASAQRSLPSPPRPASISKSELQNLGSSSMSLEDRLRLMMQQKEEDRQWSPRSEVDEQRERRMRRAGSSPDRSPDVKSSSFQIHEDEDAKIAEDDLDIQLPRIKRESILRKIKNQTFHDDFEYSSPVPSSSPERHSAINIDPDVPIPSLEDRPQPMIGEDGTIIKQEEDAESEVDLYAIPEMYRYDLPSPTGVRHSHENKEDDEESHYSTDLNGLPGVSLPFGDAEEEDSPPTPKASASLAAVRPNEAQAGSRMSLPQFAAMLSKNEFSQSFTTYMTPSPPMEEPMKKAEPVATQAHTWNIPQRPATPPEHLNEILIGSNDEFDRESTPDSVIRHPIRESFSSQEEERPVIPEPTATIKAPGGGLKTRPSLAPADVTMMAETRRKVSGEQPNVPPIPARHRNRPSVILEGDPASEENLKQPKRKSSLVQLEVPVDAEDGLSLGLDKEFDRLLEAQKVPYTNFLSEAEKLSQCISEFDFAHVNELANITSRKQKGYLMRQNTKLIVASSASHSSTDSSAPEMPPPPKGIRSAGNSPVKGSATWTTEPWNGRIRRKSIRQSGGSPMKRPTAPTGPVPPLPGMTSNITDFDNPVNETVLEDVEEFEDGAERGRVFVKVVGVKDLDLPLPRGERSYFCLTLDNGLHCVTTAWLELGRNAPVGQEFELVVLNELEFQLTLQTKIEEPKPLKVTQSPTKPQKSKQSTFSRVFQSPRKRKELEMREKEEAQKAAKQRELEAKAAKATQPSAWDLLHNLVARDGSFGRAYISLKDHENHAYGRPYTVDVPLFNEWAMEEARMMNSAKSTRSIIGGMQRKAPYKIGKLELQLLYVPKPKDATDEDMPKSMNACIRELQEAERTSQQFYEGHLSQQGGDCPYWRRRFFRLQGSKLTAYHESTRQPRATINLAKASKLIDDKSQLTQKEVSGKGGARRRSAFAAEEEGYMFVEEGFRVRFGNGEVIDFYADNTVDKEAWMRVLFEVVGKDHKSSKSWTETVLRRERSRATMAAKTAPNSTAMKSAPNTPAGMRHARKPSVDYGVGAGSPQKTSFSRPFSQMPALPRPNSAEKPLPSGPPGARDPRLMSEAERRAKARSMLF